MADVDNSAAAPWNVGTTAATRLAERWYQILTEAGPEPPAETLWPQLKSLAVEALQFPQTEKEARATARRLGERLFQAVQLPLNVAVEVQAAWLAEAAQGLPTPPSPETWARLSRLAGELALGFWAAQTRARCALDAETLQRIRHDLKTPLNSITGFSKVVLKGIDGPINDIQRQDLTTVFESGRRLLAMIDDVLGTMERDARKRQPAPDTTDIATLVGELVATVQPLLAAEKHRLELSFEGRPARLDVPCASLHWMLLAVLLTWGDFVTEGQIRLSIHRLTTTAEDQVVFDFRGTAPPPEEREAVREAPPLATARRLCEEAGGQATFDVTADVFHMVLQFPVETAE
ncbi:MAG: sensor histidine kinase [Anaerolineae bacterium]